MYKRILVGLGAGGLAIALAAPQVSVTVQTDQLAAEVSRIEAEQQRTTEAVNRLAAQVESLMLRVA